MARPIVKYLDPISGEYEFATVVDVGDLRDLNTTIKSDIVGAINSIISDGVHNPINNEKIEDLERIINSLKDGTFKIDDFGSIDEYLKQQFLDELDKINEKNREEIQSVLTQLDTSVDDAIKDYQEKVAAQNIILENAENTLADARDTLEAKAAELETANIGLSELETEFNELDKYISTNVRTIDFDNFNAMVEDYETVVTQTSDEVGVDMSGSTLSYLTGRVTDAEANISAQAGEISSKMGYNEFQYMPVPKYDYGENLLFDTFDFGDAWTGKNGAQVTPDTFLFGKVVAFNSPTGLYETRTDDLTIGESYVFSTYVNVQPSEKSPSQGKYEPVSKSYDPTDFTVQIGGASFNPGVYEDLSGINGWIRINQEFVADAVNPIISITPTGVNSQNEIAYMAMPKLEKELTVTPWQPHLEDKYATMSSTQSMMKQQANSITAFVTGVEELDESYKQATSTFQMLADGFKANTEAVEVFEDTVERYGTEYSNINGKFEQKVWKDDFDAIIEDINIDNRNRVLNSDFIRNEISSTDRRLIVENWTLNSDWELKTIDDNKYLSRTRTGLTQNLITSTSSDYFLVREGERILFGFDLIHSGLDNDKIFAIELFDINNKRLLKEEFSLSSLTKVGNRYHDSFRISTPGVQKGRVVLQLPRNGSVSFTKISFQNADIGSIDWSPAPEDSWIIQSKLESYISQVEDEITIGGVGRKMDTLTGLLTEDKGTFTLNPDKIATEVFNSETYDDMGFVNKTNFEQTADGWMQEITSKGRLAGYINATPDTYRISFDKIMLEGTTWADRLGSSKIMVTENFALIGKNGRPVLNVNNDGTVEMNVSKMNIGASQVATKKDIEDIELTPGPRGKDAVTVSLETQASAYEYTADGELGPVKSRSIQAWHNAVLSGTVYYEFIVNGSTKQNTTNGEYMYKAPESYSDMPQTVEVKIREGSNSSNVLATDFITIVGIKPGLDGGDAYTVMLDNESHAFGGDVSNALANSLDIEVISYKGTDRVAASVGAISGLPKGMTVDVDDSTVSPKIRFTVTTSMTSPNGAITIPITVDGKVFNKIFTYSISFKGDKGEQGPQGLQGVSITKVDVEYAQNASEKSAPESGWSTTAPPWENGKYIWSRTKTTYSSGDPTYSKPACITGQKGSEGSNGNHGRGILSIVEQYYLSDSKETRTGGNWTTTAPKWKQGKYMWTRSQINWTNPTGTTETDPIVDIAWEAVAEATKGVGLEDKTEILSGTEIFTDKADDSVVHVEIDGKSVQEGEPNPDKPAEIHSLNDFDVVSSTEKLLEGQLEEYNYDTEYENVYKINLSLDEVLRSVGDVKVEKNTIGSEDKIYPLQSLDDWGRYYTNSSAIVTNPNDTAYQKWSFDGIPLGNMEQVRGGMFNNTFPINGHLNGGIDTPATAWAGVNISKMYLETNDDTLLPKIRAIGDFFLNHVMDIDIWSTPLKAFPNALTFDEVSGQWIPSTRFIHTRTFYHVAWALLEIYDVTKDTKYSNLAGQLLDGATMIQLMATSQANSNELPPYFSGAMFNAINNVGEESYEPSWDTFTNTNGDMVVRATNKWIELFGNSTRVSFDLYSWEEKKYTVKSIADDYISHLVYLYNNQGLRKPDGHNLLYNFSHFEWEDEPHPDGYRVPVSMNWDFINDVFGQDQWFTGDLMFWAIIGFAEAGETQIATSLLDRYYELKAPDSEGRLLFHDRYTAQGKHLINDTSKSIAFTGLYMQARNILGNHDYDAECLSALKHYQKESEFNTVDGGFSWDTEDYNSFIENKSLGEILFSIMGNASVPEDIAENDNHLTLSEPLRSVGDVKDRLFRDSDGLWKIERNVGEATFDGTEEWGIWYTRDTSGMFGLLSRNLKEPMLKAGGLIISNMFPSMNVNSSDEEGVHAGTEPRLRVRAFYERVGTTPKSTDDEKINSFKQWLSNTYTEGVPLTIVYEVEVPTIQILDQELQNKLNNLRSFQDSNYVYTIVNDKTNILSENLKPTLHATFKGGGWYSRWKTEDDLRKQQAEINDKADNKSTEESINTVVGDLQMLQQELEAAATANELSDFIEKYNKDMESRDNDKRASEESLSTALRSISSIEKDMGEMSETWDFIDRFIKNTPEGIVVGSDAAGSYILIKEDRISFYSNNQEVAFISQNLMEISRGAFVEQIQVAKYQFEESTNNHLTIRYVG